MLKSIKGIDTSLFDSVVVLYLNNHTPVKGEIPEIVKSFYPMPVPVVLAVKYENEIAHYSLYQMESDTFNHLGNGEKIATKDDGSIYLWENTINKDNQVETKIYLLELDSDAFYAKTELIFR